MFADEKVRQAFSRAIDIDASVEEIFFGEYPRAWSILGPTTPGYDASLEGSWPIDRELANSLLDEAGWTQRDADGIRIKDGQRLSARWIAWTPIPDDRAALANAIQSDLKEVGFEVTREELEPGAYNEQYGPKTFDLTDWSFSGVDADLLRSHLHTRRVPERLAGHRPCCRRAARERRRDDRCRRTRGRLRRAAGMERRARRHRAAVRARPPSRRSGERISGLQLRLLRASALLRRDRRADPARHQRYDAVVRRANDQKDRRARGIRRRRAVGRGDARLPGVPGDPRRPGRRDARTPGPGERSGQGRHPCGAGARSAAVRAVRLVPRASCCGAIWASRTNCGCRWPR